MGCRPDQLAPHLLFCCGFRRRLLACSQSHIVDSIRQSTAIKLTLAALERHLQGMTEKMRSGVLGKVCEAIE